jgi:hypothetical protein
MVAIRGRRLPFGTEHSQIPLSLPVQAVWQRMGAYLPRCPSELGGECWRCFFGNIFF